LVHILLVHTISGPLSVAVAAIAGRAHFNYSIDVKRGIHKVIVGVDDL
jgi:hypothetical protein